MRAFLGDLRYQQFCGNNSFKLLFCEPILHIEDFIRTHVLSKQIKAYNKNKLITILRNVKRHIELREKFTGMHPETWDIDDFAIWQAQLIQQTYFLSYLYTLNFVIKNRHTCSLNKLNSWKFDAQKPTVSNSERNRKYLNK